MKPVTVVISGSTASGKTHVAHELQTLLGDGSALIKTMTTRPERASEAGGGVSDHVHVTREKFRSLLESGALVEHDMVGENFYGLPKQSVDDALSANQTPIMVLTPDGADALDEFLSSRGAHSIKVYIDSDPVAIKLRIAFRFREEFASAKSRGASPSEMSDIRAEFTMRVRNLAAESEWSRREYDLRLNNDHTQSIRTLAGAIAQELQVRELVTRTVDTPVQQTSSPSP